MGKPLAIQYMPLLRAVTRIRNKNLQRKVLGFLCEEIKFRNCICEIAHNVVKENIPLTTSHKKKLNKQTKLVKRILKKQSLSQSGGFLNVVVPLLAAQIGELIYSKIRK